MKFRTIAKRQNADSSVIFEFDPRYSLQHHSLVHSFLSNNCNNHYLKTITIFLEAETAQTHPKHHLFPINTEMHARTRQRLVSVVGQNNVSITNCPASTLREESVAGSTQLQENR